MMLLICVPENKVLKTQTVGVNRLYDKIEYILGIENI